MSKILLAFQDEEMVLFLFSATPSNPYKWQIGKIKFHLNGYRKQKEDCIPQMYVGNQSPNGSVRPADAKYEPTLSSSNPFSIKHELLQLLVYKLRSAVKFSSWTPLTYYPSTICIIFEYVIDSYFGNSECTDLFQWWILKAISCYYCLL